VIKLLDEVRF